MAEAFKMPNPEELSHLNAQQVKPLENVFCKGLEGKVALVTGGASGLGFMTAYRLCEGGAKVVIASRGKERGNRAVEELKAKGFEASWVKTDITNVSDCYNAVAFAEKTYGGLDIAVANAAGWSNYAYLDMPEESFDQVVDTDLKGEYFLGQAAARSMVKNKVKGKIIFISSAAYKGEGAAGIVMNTHYIAAKGAVVAMTKGIAGELGQYGIKVNCVAPGGMLTAGAMTNGRTSAALYGEEYGKISLKHRGETPLAMNPDEVALVVYAMCTDMSNFMAGDVVDVDGGVLMNRQERPFSFTMEGCVPGPKKE